jgi:hypothetical protein
LARRRRKKLAPTVTKLLQSRAARYIAGRLKSAVAADPQPSRRTELPGHGTLTMNAPAPVSDHALPQASVPLPIRYFDVLLVLAFLPFGLLAGLPELGVVAGVAIWVAQRALGVAIDNYAADQEDFRRATGARFAGGMARPLILGLTILAIGQLGEREDGLTAALIALVAFTIYMVLSFIFRPTRNARP